MKRTPLQALAAACAHFGEGGQQKLADALTGAGHPCSASAISQWRAKLHQGFPLPLERCEPIEAVTDGAVRVEELRPDLRWRRDASGRVVGVEKPIKPTARHVRKRARPPARTRAPRNPDLHAGR